MDAKIHLTDNIREYLRLGAGLMPPHDLIDSVRRKFSLTPIQARELVIEWLRETN